MAELPPSSIEAKEALRRAAAWQVSIERTGCVLARRALIARSLLQRLTGLLRHQALPEGEGLVLLACRSVHTVGMRFAIDVVFVDQGWRVVGVQASMEPGRCTPVYWRACAAIEVPAGAAAVCDVRVGDTLRCQPVETAAGRRSSSVPGSLDFARDELAGGSSRQEPA